MADWQYLNPYGQGQPGAPTYWGGGSQQIAMRDPLDSMRSRVDGKIPSAEYPDGYLGTIQSRREDRLLNALKARVNQKAYQRGVHKGERIEPSDYEWPPEFQPNRGIQRQAKTDKRFAPLGTMQERMLVNNGKATPIGGDSFTQAALSDPTRMAQLRNLGPSWR